MSFRGFRRALAAHPRCLLAVLLAFGLEILPPSVTVVSHRHAGGDVPHVHAGSAAAASHGDAAIGETARGDGLRHSPARDLHQHVVQPVVVAAGLTVAAPAPLIVATAVPAVIDLHPIVPAMPAGHARAPPALAV
jgi:hypothetical protein